MTKILVNIRQNFGHHSPKFWLFIRQNFGHDNDKSFTKILVIIRQNFGCSFAKILVTTNHLPKFWSSFAKILVVHSPKFWSRQIIYQNFGHHSLKNWSFVVTKILVFHSPEYLFIKIKKFSHMIKRYMSFSKRVR